VMGPVDACPPDEDEVDDDLPTVCVTHLRFIPCRGTAWREHACVDSTHPDAVAAVRNFQNGLTSD
jgi:hypothetical protein